MGEEAHYMSWLELGMILFGFSSPSGVMGVAYSIGTCGVIMGPIVAVGVTIATCYGALMFNEMIIALDGCDAQLEALGGAILGEHGRLWGRLIQQGNFVLYLPVALLICAEAFQGFAEPSGDTCVDFIIIGISLLCFMSTMFRRLSGRAASYLSYLSLACVVVIISLLLVIVFETERPENKARRAGNPEMFSDREIIRLRGYAKLCLGASTTAWAYVPTFLTVELTRALKNPREDFKKGLIFSATLNNIVFFVVGLSTVIQWGWDVQDPIMASEDLWPASSRKSRVLFLLWFITTLISYAFSSMALTTACQIRWAPNADFETDWSLSSHVKWALIALPTFVLAVVLAIIVPSLFAMLAVTTALTVPWVNHIYPSILYYKFTRPDFHVAELASPASREENGAGNEVPLLDQKPRPKLMWKNPLAYISFVLVVGVVIFIACAFGAGVKLFDHKLRGPMSIGCPSWYLFTDDMT